MFPTAGVPEAATKETKALRLNKWKDRLFNADGVFGREVDDRESDDQDVAHFLGNNSRQVGRSPPSSHVPRLQTDKLDQWASKSGSSSPPPPENIYHPAGPRKKKGLRVAFVANPPYIIGEGGDEAESPAIFVSQNKTLPTDPLLERQPPLQRRPTGNLQLPLDDDEDLDDDTSETKSIPAVPQLSLGAFEQSPLSLENPKTLEPVTSDEHSPVSPISSSSESSTLSPDLNLERSTQLQASPSTLEPALITGGGNSLTPRVSPAPSSQRSARASPDPSPQRPGIGATNLSTRTSGPQDQSHLVRKPLPSAPDSKATDVSLQPHPKPKGISFRHIAKGIGTDALEDFSARVVRFHSIFRLGIAVNQDILDIPFKTWIRTAAWWFLRGRAELESAVRNASTRSAHGTSQELPDVPTGLKQAYVNLGKASWIVKEITPNHPEIQRYGSASMLSMVAIIQNFGQQELAGLAQAHVDIVANMRALTISMKRNNRMPPDDIEVEGSDMRVILDNFEVPVEIAKGFSPHLSELRDNSYELMMPLGDTPRYFTYSRLFGTGLISSRADSQQTITAPCIMTLVRGKEALDLTASLSNQEGSFGLKVQTTKEKPWHITWKDVKWITPANTFRIILSGGIEFSIAFSEADYKSLWNICDYTRKVQKDFLGRKGEEVVFEAEMHDFQCIQTARHPSSFPQDPISGCAIRLFSKSKAFVDGTGRIMAGYRLMSRTPPGVKALSSISQEYGDDLPTLFGFSRREERPRLGVRVPGSATFVLGFHAWGDLDGFYNLFTQRQALGYEERSASLPLQSLEIATEDQTLGQRSRHLSHVRWQSVKVLTPKGRVSLTESSAQAMQSLRIVAECDAGILTDRLNLGMPDKHLVMSIRLTFAAPGDLQIALGVDNCNEIRLLRPPQRNLFVSLTEFELSEDAINSWRGMLWTAGRSTVIKSFHFRSLPGEACTTNFRVINRLTGLQICIHSRVSSQASK